MLIFFSHQDKTGPLILTSLFDILLTDKVWTKEEFFKNSIFIEISMKNYRHEFSQIGSIILVEMGADVQFNIMVSYFSKAKVQHFSLP